MSDVEDIYADIRPSDDELDIAKERAWHLFRHGPSGVCMPGCAAERYLNIIERLNARIEALEEQGERPFER